MSTESPSKGWVLHSAGRKFGPMSEDDLRTYFRAGMVKSVDRLTAPGEFVMRAAGEVALQLGETPPAGPPPPAIDADAPVPPFHAPTLGAPGAEADKPLDPRAMEAIARMQMELATSRPPERKRPGWIGPAVVVLGLVIMMFVGLNMLKKMKPPADTPGEAVIGKMPPPSFGADAAAVPASVQDLPPSVAMRPAAANTGGDAELQGAIQRAELLQSARQWAELVAHAKLWAQMQPDRREPWQYLALAHTALGDHAAAADAYARLLQSDPDDRVVRQSLADAYLASGKHAEAVALYARLATADARDARLWNNYGMALRATGQAVQAAAALETAVRLDPGFKQAWTNLGQTYQELGDSSKAAAAFANAR